MSITCQYFPYCSGCQEEATKNPPVFQEAAGFFKKVGISLFLEKQDWRGWRVRSKLAVRNHLIGLFKKASHEVIEIPNCPLHHTRLNIAQNFFRTQFLASGLSGYNEERHVGDLRYLQFVVERGSGQVQLTLVLNKSEDSLDGWKKFCHTLFSSPQQPFHSIWINLQSQKGNTIFGQNWIHLYGPKYIWERVGERQIPFLPSHFGQANLDLFEVLLKDLKTLIKPKSRVCELYAGVGVISFNIVDTASHCLVTEREKEAQNGFTEAYERLPYPLQKKIEFRVSDAKEAAALLDLYDTIIVDPPRKGLEEKVIDEICKNKSIHNLIYVSCNFSSFEKNTVSLLQQGWRIDFAKSYLFFPGSDQIEVLTRFIR